MESVQKRINKFFSTLAISIAHVKVFSSVEKRFAEFFVDLLSWVLIFLIQCRSVTTASYLVDIKLFQGKIVNRQAC
jgi:hypothetical protein